MNNKRFALLGFGFTILLSALLFAWSTHTMSAQNQPTSPIAYGYINADGSIEKGAQNLPGNWESSKFNLPASLLEGIPQIGEHDTAILMHNDGVVQGLSEVPFMQDVDRWGVLTIGTGLGNARFTNRRKENGKEKDSAENGKKKGKDSKKNG